MSTIRPSVKMTMLIVGVFVLVLGGCAAPTSQPQGQETQPAAPAATEAPTTAPSTGGALARKDILVIPSNVNIPAPDIWNPYIPGTFILQGMNQNMMEPLFMLNYETGEIDGWLAESFSNNEDLSEWTVKLRPGTEWSDGTPLTADDMVFTINMVKE